MPTSSFKITSKGKSRTVDAQTAKVIAAAWIGSANTTDKITLERTDNEDLLELFGIGGDEEVAPKA